MSRIDYSPLLLATVVQAVRDWRALCQGKFQTDDCNFEELEQFFVFVCDTYLLGTDLSAERILNKLQAERRKSGLWGK